MYKSATSERLKLAEMKREQGGGGEDKMNLAVTLNILVHTTAEGNISP